MAVSPEIFPPRKRRPSAAAFIAPKFSDGNLVKPLLVLSQEVSCLKPIHFLLKRSSITIIRKTKLLSIFFAELLQNPTPYSSSALLCFEEIYILLQRIKTLIEDCSNGSKMWLLIQNESIANSFHELTAELSTLLDIFPIEEVNLTDDVVELVLLIKKQCAEAKAFVDPRDDNLRREVLMMLDRIKREIAPENSALQRIFNELGLENSSSCKDEIESLEEEVQNQIEDKSKSELVALIGLVLYAKCVLYGASTPGGENQRRKPLPEVNIPVDFRCPITLELMRDPVVVATGQTYDRESISQWIESGRNTCPKTGQDLAHTNLIPNLALKNLMAMWCREHKITEDVKINSKISNKTALEATKMTVTFLVNQLSVGSQSTEAANGVVYELRSLAKTNSESRTCIAEAGAIPKLVPYLGSESPSLQVNAVTTILNLSIIEANKTRIMETDGVLNGVIEVLRSGATWEAKGNAAATIFSLCGAQAYRKRLGKKTRVIRGLLDLAMSSGPTSAKQDALVAVLSLCGDRETVGRLVEGGVVETVTEAMDALPEEAVTILEAVVKRGGVVAVTAAQNSVKKLGMLLREGSDLARESAAATLLTICRKGGSEMVAELAAMAGIERMIWDLMGSGTVRARRKAATLLKTLRRWAAGLEVDYFDGYASNSNATVSNSSTRAVLSS